MGQVKRWRSEKVAAWMLRTARRDDRLAGVLNTWREMVYTALRSDRQLSRNEVSAACLPFAVASALDDLRGPALPTEQRIRLAGGLLRDADAHLMPNDRTLCLALIAAGSSGGGGALPSNAGAAPPQRTREGPTR